MITAERKYLFPFRTQSSSSHAPMILGIPGKVGCCQDLCPVFEFYSDTGLFFAKIMDFIHTAFFASIDHFYPSSPETVQNYHNHRAPFLSYIFSPEVKDEAIYRLHVGTTPDRNCLLYTSPSPRDKRQSRMPSSA